MNIKNKLGNRVRELRKEQVMKQQELADKTGFHRTYISDIERGVKNVNLENIAMHSFIIVYKLIIK